MRQTPSRLGPPLVAADAACFGINVTLSRLLAALGYDVLAIASLRLVFNLAIFLLWFRWRGIPWRWPTRAEHLRFLILGTAGPALFGRLSYFSALHTSVATAEALLYTGPVWALLLGAAMLGEPMRPRRWLTIFLAFAGVLLVVTGGQLSLIRLSLVGCLAGLGSGVSLAVNAVYGRRFMVQDGYPAISTLLWAYFYGTPIGLLLSPHALLLPWQFTPRAWMLFLGLAGITAAGYLLNVHGLALTEAAAATVISTLEVVFATLTAFLWLGEHPVGLQAVGVVVVLAAAWLAAWEGSRSDRGAPVPTAPA